MLNVSQRLDKLLDKKVKAFMRLPNNFPSSHIWLPARNGGLGIVELHRIAQCVKLKCMCRLMRLAHLVVDFLFKVLSASHRCITTLTTFLSGLQTLRSSIQSWKRALQHGGAACMADTPTRTSSPMCSSNGKTFGYRTTSSWKTPTASVLCDYSQLWPLQEHCLICTQLTLPHVSASNAPKGQTQRFTFYKNADQ